nr:hypothetical protein [Rhizobium sullae]
MQRVDKNSDILPVRRVRDMDGGGEIARRSPRHKFKICGKASRRRHVCETAKRDRLSRKVGIITRHQDMPGSQLAAAVAEALQQFPVNVFA